MTRSPVIEVVAAVIERDGKFLACRRRPEKAAGGKWEFPGGKLEKGETQAQALVREIQEELDSEIEVTDAFRTDDTIVGANTIRLICLRARIVGAPPKSSLDHDELRWVSREELDSLDWAAPDLTAVRQLVEESASR